MKKFLLTLFILWTGTVSANLICPEYPLEDYDLTIPTNVWHRFQFSVFSPVQTAYASDSVAGIRFNLFYGESYSIHGLDIGFANWTYGNMKGLELGLSNIVMGDLHGLQIGLHNCINQNGWGWQLGCSNVCGGFFNGLQLGLFNYAYALKGMQLGIFNVSYQPCGIQIGLMNIISCDPCCDVLPFFNWRW